MVYLGQQYSFSNNDATIELYGSSKLIEYPISNYNADYPLDDASGEEYIAFPIIPTSNVNFTGFAVYGKKVGAAVSQLVRAELRNDSAGSPGSVLVANTSFNNYNLVDIDSVNYQLLTFTKTGSPQALTAGTKYWVTVRAQTAGAPIHLLLAVDSSPAIEGRNNSAPTAATPWTPLTNLAIYEIYTNQTRQISQGFLQSAEAELAEIHLELIKTGTPGGSLTVQICEDSGGIPNLGVIPTNGTSQSVNMATVGTSATEITFTFSPAPVLDPTKHYHLVLTSSIPLSLTDNIGIRVDQTDPAYGGGSFHYLTSVGSWVEVLDTDAGFETYYNDPSPSTPDLIDALENLGDAPSNCSGLQSYINSLVTILKSNYPPLVLPERGGTGLEYYQQGDMLYATGPNHLERLPLGAFGSIMKAGFGAPEWSSDESQNVYQIFRAASSSLLFNGVIQENHLVYLTGDGRITNQPQVGTTLTDGSRRSFIGIAAETITANSEGRVLIFGVSIIEFITLNTTNRVVGQQLVPIDHRASLPLGGVFSTNLTILELISGGGGGGFVRVFLNSTGHNLAGAAIGVQATPGTINFPTTTFTNLVFAVTAAYQVVNTISTANLILPIVNDWISIDFHAALLASIAVNCRLGWEITLTGSGGAVGVATNYDDQIYLPVGGTAGHFHVRNVIEIRNQLISNNVYPPNAYDLYASVRLRIIGSGASNVTFAPTATAAAGRITLSHVY